MTQRRPGVRCRRAEPVHHIELWTADFDRFAPGLDWLLSELGWGSDDDPVWHRGRTWQHPSGVYLVLEQSPTSAAAMTGPVRG